MAKTRVLLEKLFPAAFRLRNRLQQRRVEWGLQTKGGAFLTDFFAAADEAGIRPFLLWGTLLGAIREDGFVKGDNDVDVGILHHDYARRDQLIAAMARRGYPLRKSWERKLCFAGPVHKLHLDLDVFYPFGDEMISTTVDADGGLTGARFPASTLLAFREIRILGGAVKVTVPDPPEPLLEAMYGPGWRVPDPGYDSSTDLHNRLHFEPDAKQPHFPAE